MKLKKIYEYIDSLAPFSNQEAYDNSGLITGGMDCEINTVCISLDATHDVVKEAVEKNAELIITHHPVIFKPIYSVIQNTPLHELVKNNINLISAHTNFDSTKGCMTDIMLDMLGFPHEGDLLREINKNGAGYGRAVDLENTINVLELCQKVKDVFKCSVVRYTDGKKLIKRIGICSGSSGDELENAVKLGCDALITGDIKWSVFVAAQNYGFTLIDAGHFHTENIFCEFLSRKLRGAFPELDVFVAKSNIDVCKYLF